MSGRLPVRTLDWQTRRGFPLRIRFITLFHYFAITINPPVRGNFSYAKNISDRQKRMEPVHPLKSQYLRNHYILQNLSHSILGLRTRTSIKLLFKFLTIYFSIFRFPPPLSIFINPTKIRSLTALSAASLLFFFHQPFHLDPSLCVINNTFHDFIQFAVLAIICRCDKICPVIFNQLLSGRFFLI